MINSIFVTRNKYNELTVDLSLHLQMVMAKEIQQKNVKTPDEVDDLPEHEAVDPHPELPVEAAQPGLVTSSFFSRKIIDECKSMNHHW